MLVAALTPAAAAVWLTPWFVTQDGPAHLYNASLLLDALRGRLHPAQQAAYAFSWRPVPNWGGHALLMGLLALFPPRVADCLMTTLTLAGPPTAALWARAQVWGRRGQRTAAIGFACLGASLPWLLGFGAFLLGMTVGLFTLGLAWRWRDRMDGPRAAALAGLLAVGYLGHLVALALTAGGLAFLAVDPRRVWAEHPGRLIRRLAPLGVLVPLFLLYRSVAEGSGRFAPSWEHLTSWTDPAAWSRQLGWADPITLGRRTLPPLFPADPSPAWLLLAPVAWFAAGIGSAGLAGSSHRRAWMALGAAAGLGALIGPDSFGPDHGHYLPQRLALFGLFAAVIGLDLGGRGARWAAPALGIAMALQVAHAWDYAAESSARVGPLMAVRESIGTGRRVGTLLADVRGRHRANPLLHADCGLGVGTGHVIWSNYEPRFYYFPVGLRAGGPPPAAFEEAAIRDRPDEAAARAAGWERLLEAHGRSIDVLLCYGVEPALDRATFRGFDPRPVCRSGPVRVLRARSIAPASAGPLE